MAKSVVIVESPAKAKTINKILGKNYKVMASMGHVRDLPEKKLGIDIEHDFEPEYQIIRGRGKIINELKKASKSSEKVYLAPDRDREGEAIAWHLIHALGIPAEKALRITFNEITSKAIHEAFRSPGIISLDKVKAQQARRILDRLVGYKLSPLLWKKVAKGLSAGRVQSVAVKLIVDREREIEAFKPEEFWKITAFLFNNGDLFSAELAKYRGKELKIQNEKDARHLVELLREKDFIVASLEKKEKTERPLPPFTTSHLQQQASIRLKFSAKKTMVIAQQLYEGLEVGSEGAVGLITYMRTDSFRVSDDALKEARSFIPQEYGNEYLPERAVQYASKAGAQMAHEAIRPTSVLRKPESLKDFLSKDQFLLYDLIWKRFIASQMIPARYALTIAQIEAGEGLFTARGRELLFDGFTRVHPAYGSKDLPLLPPMEEGQKLRLQKLEPSQHFTQPPPRYTEATLVKALEKYGIGRPSTYAPIITTIQERGYVTQKQRRFYAQEMGKVVTDRLVQYFPNIINIDFTSKMEEELDEIEETKRNWVDVLRSFYQIFEPTLKAAYKEMPNMKQNPEESGVTCEKCGKPMVFRLNKHGKFLGCSGFPECKNTLSLDENGEVFKPESLDEKCEKCGKPMVVKRGKRGPFVACSGFPDCRNTRSIGQKAKKPPQETGELCEKCGSPLVIRYGRRGPFIACSAFPKCRNTRSLPKKAKEEVKRKPSSSPSR